MATPAWIGASPAQPQLAAQVDQFLGTHAATYVYTGVSLGSAAVGSGSVATNGLYVAQAFSPASNQSPGRFVLTMSVTGTPPPLALSIQTTASSSPSGTVLAAVWVPYTYFTGTAAALSFPMPCSFTGGSTYWIVANAVGDASDFYSLSKSASATGVRTSANGTSWTAQSYGLAYNRFDQSPVLPLLHTWEDSGARWTTLAANSSNQPTSLDEYTAAQGGQYVYSSRSLTYSSGELVSIT